MGRGLASCAPACIFAKLRNIVKYFIISVIYNYLVTVINLIKFWADTAIGDFARTIITEHRDIVLMGKALDIRLRNFLATVLFLICTGLTESFWSYYSAFITVNKYIFGWIPKNSTIG